MGTNLHGISDEDLRRELERRQAEAARFPFSRQSPVGWWHVTTEGDCEGRSTNDLGVHHGHLGDVLLMLSPMAYYSLHVRPTDAPGGRSPTPATSVAANCSGLGDTDAEKLRSWLGAGWSVPGCRNGQISITKTGR